MVQRLKVNYKLRAVLMHKSQESLILHCIKVKEEKLVLHNINHILNKQKNIKVVKVQEVKY
jgi:hypothetical protein